jgi:hypothetical protein
MKKIIVAIALVLTSAVTAFSLTISNKKTEGNKLDKGGVTITVKSTSAQRSDIATAD